MRRNIAELGSTEIGFTGDPKHHQSTETKGKDDAEMGTVDVFWSSNCD